MSGAFLVLKMVHIMQIGKINVIPYLHEIESEVNQLLHEMKYILFKFERTASDRRRN